MATELTMLEDNTKFRVYGPNTTSTRISPWNSRLMDTRYYKGTYWYALNPGSFLFYFEGTSVAFFGTVPSSPSQRPTVIIDDYSVANLETFDDPTGSTYRQWFQSPTLTDGFHAISVENLTSGTALDFAAIKVGTRNFNLTLATLVVDNESPSILYSGHWSRNTSVFTSGTTLRAYPYGNSTHRSSTPGDTFTFRFTGTSVSVYGTFLMSNVGVLGATYTLDGATIPQIRNITLPTHQEAPNFLHYSLNNLPPGDHTLTVNITVANNQTFVLDYITYNPSFELVLTMPLLDNSIPTTTSGSINSSNPSGSSTSRPSQVQPLPIAAILGGVTGVLSVALLAILGRWLFLRRRKAKKIEDPSPYYLYEYHQPENDANNQHLQKRERQHVPEAQPLYSDPRGLQPVKFMPQVTDSHIRPIQDQPPDIDIRPTVTDSKVICSDSKP